MIWINTEDVICIHNRIIEKTKGIGAMMTQLLLKWNSYPLELQSGELADMFIAIADRTSGEEKLLQWIKAHRKTERRNEIW